MRKWHRWLSVFFGVFLFWIAATGLLSQAADLWPDLGSSGEPTAAQIAAAQPPEGWECPAGWRCRPPEISNGIGSLKGFFHHLHSGEEFGLPGVIISVLSGFALAFFSVSGLWMYWKMWRNRAAKNLQGGMLWK